MVYFRSNIDEVMSSSYLSLTKHKFGSKGNDHLVIRVRSVVAFKTVWLYIVRITIDITELSGLTFELTEESSTNTTRMVWEHPARCCELIATDQKPCECLPPAQTPIS